MDRLPTLIVLVCLIAWLSACDDVATRAPPSRVVAVAAEEEPVSPLCDRQFDASDAPPMRWPALADGAAPPPPAAGPRWVNVWATWCAPCVEEMPRLSRWEARLQTDGAAVEMRFLSADSDPSAVETFREAHPEAPETLRMADPTELEAWATSLGLPGASLPVHVLLDAENRVRCLRAGGVGEDDYAAARAALTSL